MGGNIIYNIYRFSFTLLLCLHFKLIYKAKTLQTLQTYQLQGLVIDLMDLHIQCIFMYRKEIHH